MVEILEALSPLLPPIHLKFESTVHSHFIESMSAPVDARFVPTHIEPEAAPNVEDPRLLESIASFVSDLQPEAVCEALEAFWLYKDGILRQALDTYAHYAVNPSTSTSSAGRHRGKATPPSGIFVWDHFFADAVYIVSLLLEYLTDEARRRLLRLVLLLYANDRVQTRSGNQILLPGEALKREIQTFDSSGLQTEYNFLGLWWRACEKADLWKIFRLGEPPVAVVVDVLRSSTPCGRRRNSKAAKAMLDDVLLPVNGRTRKSATSGADGVFVPLETDSDSDLASTIPYNRETEGLGEEINVHREGLRVVFEAMAYLQSTEGRDVTKLCGYVGEVAKLRTYTPDRYAEMLETLCESATKRFMAWANEPEDTLLPTLAEAEGWAVTTQQHCMRIGGGRGTSKAVAALMNRVVALCCSGKGQVISRKGRESSIHTNFEGIFKAERPSTLPALQQ